MVSDLLYKIAPGLLAILPAFISYLFYKKKLDENDKQFKLIMSIETVVALVVIYIVLWMSNQILTELSDIILVSSATAPDTQWYTVVVFLLLFAIHIIFVLFIYHTVAHNTKALQSISTGVFLKKRDECNKDITQIIKQAKSEIFVSGINLISWSGHVSSLLARKDIKVKILLLDTKNDVLHKEFESMRGRSTYNTSPNYLDKFLTHPDIEIRIIRSIMPVLFLAMDMETNNGYIKAQHLFNNSDSTKTPNVELTKQDGEWYNNYYTQLKAVWDRGEPWDVTQ